MSAALPSATIRSPPTAIACASGSESSMVRIRPFVTTSVAGSCCVGRGSAPAEGSTSRNRNTQTWNTLRVTCLALDRKQAIEIAAKDLFPIVTRNTNRPEHRFLHVVNGLLPSAWKERRVGAKQHPVGAGDGNHLTEDLVDREAGIVLDPAVGTRCVEMDGAALLDRHQRLAQHARAEVGNDDRDAGKPRRDRGHGQRIAEPQIKR